MTKTNKDIWHKTKTKTTLKIGDEINTKSYHFLGIENTLLLKLIKMDL